MKADQACFSGGSDGCLSMFGLVYATGALVFPSRAAVLEIGCAEADWTTPMLECRPDLMITAIDWRPAQCSPRATVIRGDVLTYDFPTERFDVVVGVSSIEHIGLGHYDNDPPDGDGDRHCMDRVVRWLKPGGWVYADVPYGQDYQVVGTSHRVYNDAALEARLVPAGLRVTQRWYVHDHDMALLDRPTEPNGPQMSYAVLLAHKE